MENIKPMYEPFDFYETPMGFKYGEKCFLIENYGEKLVKLNNYDITEQDAFNYKALIKEKREEVEHRHKIFCRRSNFFKIITVIILIWFFLFVIGYFNDFFRNYKLLFDGISIPFYIGLIWVLYKYAYFGISYVIDSTQTCIENIYKYPFEGHPEGYNPRIEKYYSDLLWEIWKNNKV